jgi:hypothetical protein
MQAPLHRVRVWCASIGREKRRSPLSIRNHVETRPSSSHLRFLNIKTPVHQQNRRICSIQGNDFDLVMEETVMRAMILAFCIGAIVAAIAGCGSPAERKPGYTGVDSGYDSKQSKVPKQ